MKQIVIEWKCSDDWSGHPELTKKIEQGNTIVNVIPTTWYGTNLARVTHAIIIYTEPEYGKA